MSSAQILRLLRDPLDFAQDTVDADIWESAFSDIAEPLTEAAKVPLRSAQVYAWHGLATARAGLILGPPGNGKRTEEKTSEIQSLMRITFAVFCLKKKKKKYKNITLLSFIPSHKL